MLPRASSKKRYERFRQAYHAGKTKELSLYRKKEKDQDFSDRDSRSKKDRRRHYLRNYVRWLWKFWPTVVLLIVLSLVAAVLELAHPLFLRYILDNVLLSENLTTASRVRQLNLIGSGLLAVIVVGQCIGVFKNYRTRQLNIRVMISLRRALYDRLLHLSLGDLTDMKTGGVISRLSGDVNTTSGLLQLGLISPGVSLIRLVIAIGMLFFLNWQLALAAIMVLPIAVAISFLIAKRIRPIYRAVRDDAQHVDGRVGETFGGIRVVRGFQRESLEEINYNIGRHEIVRKQLFAQRREICAVDGLGVHDGVRWTGHRLVRWLSASPWSSVDWRYHRISVVRDAAIEPRLADCQFVFRITTVACRDGTSIRSVRNGSRQARSPRCR